MFQPYSAYFTEIVKLRISRNNNPWAHYKATSKLSRMLLKSLLAILVSLALLSFLKFNTMFTYENVLVVSVFEYDFNIAIRFYANFHVS